jgi:hypothetical protein
MGRERMVTGVVEFLEIEIETLQATATLDGTRLDFRPSPTGLGPPGFQYSAGRRGPGVACLDLALVSRLKSNLKSREQMRARSSGG